MVRADEQADAAPARIAGLNDAERDTGSRRALITQHPASTTGFVDCAQPRVGRPHTPID